MDDSTGRVSPVQIYIRSIDLILAPITSRVSQLLSLCGSASDVSTAGTPPFDMKPKISSLQAVMVELAAVAEKTVAQFSDDELAVGLPQACERTSLASRKIADAAGTLCSGVRTLNGHHLAQITANSQELMNGCIQLLVTWDGAEVRKIVDAGNRLLDRLRLVEAAKSMRGLLICLKGFSEPLFIMLALLDKRLKELTSVDMKRDLTANLDSLKQCIPKLTAAAQACIRNPQNDNAKSFRSYYVMEIERTVGQIIVVVQKSVPSIDALATQAVVKEYPLTRAATIVKTQVQLRSPLRYEDNSDLEHNINAILHNSMAVAHVSRDKFRSMITQLCTEVQLLYKELKQQRRMLALNPNSAELRAQCDGTAELLSNKLLLLEKTVSESVVDQISDAFVGTSAPLEHLVTAAVTSQYSSSENSEDDRELSKKATLFRKHSRRLSQVALHAAEGVSDPSMVQQIKDTAAQVEKLAPQVTSAALSARHNPRDRQAQQHLTLVKDEWAAKVKQLTAVVDDVTDAQELLTASETLIREDMARCRDAIHHGDGHGVQTAVATVERRCHRLLELAKNELRNTEDPVQSYSLTTTIAKMENALSQMTSSYASVLSNVHDVAAQKNLASSLRQIVDVTKELKQVLAAKRPRKTVATSTPMPMSHPVLLTRGARVDAETSMTTEMKRHTPYISMQTTISPIHMSGKAPLIYSTPIESSPSPYSPSILMQPSVGRAPAFGEHPEGFSRSYSTGDAETQTPMSMKRDQNPQTQVEHQVTFPVYPIMVDRSSSTTNLHSQTTMSIALQTDTDLLADVSIIDDPHGPYAAYVLPGQRMVSSVLSGDAELVEQHASELRSRVDKLIELGYQTIKASPEDSALIREIRQTVSQVKKLTKALLDEAEDLLSDSENLSKAEQVKEVGREWADSVLALAAAVERGSQPWGNPLSRLTAEAAKGGRQLEHEIKHVNERTEQLVDTAMATVQAMEATLTQQDVETVRIVKVTASVIAKLAPVLIQTAREASSSQSSMESLNLISQEWATNAKLLAHSMDAITDPSNSPMDHLASSSSSGEVQNYAEEVSNAQTLTATLQEVTQNAIMGCSDSEMIKLVTVTARKIEKLTTELNGCAKAVMTASTTSEHTTAVEQFTVVKHNWKSNVQLLTAHVDDLISKMAAPLSKLYSVAVTINKTESHTTRQHLVNQFAQMSDKLQENVNMLEATFNETVLGVHGNVSVDAAGDSIKVIAKLTPHSITAARSVIDDQSSAMVEHFHHLKRQWAAKAQSLHTQLMTIASVDMTPVLAVFEDMISVALPNGVEVSTSSIPGEWSSPHGSDKEASPMRPVSQEGTHKVVMRPPHATTERPVTIAVPQQATPSYNSITAAAWSLHQEADKFVSEGNPIISTAKEMSDHMRQLAEYTRGRGHIETKEDMIIVAKEVASNARIIVDYAKKIAQQCTDTRMKYNIEQSVELIPTLATQLTIISSVKAATPNDISADVMLVKNAQNLMEAVIKTMREAEAACMKGLTPSDDPEESEAVALALNWKKNLYHRRNMESVRAPLGKKGLRKMDKSASTSSLVDVIEKARARSIGSPPKR